ncbi:hypothetical protein ADK58_30630 [Streptomyces sp. XY152]|nr:hypothetical protein ADK58_30630 [Streptomyces sp. XY152]
MEGAGFGVGALPAAFAAAALEDRLRGDIAPVAAGLSQFLEDGRAASSSGIAWIVRAVRGRG